MDPTGNAFPADACDPDRVLEAFPMGSVFPFGTWDPERSPDEKDTWRLFAPGVWDPDLSAEDTPEKTFRMTSSMLPDSDDVLAPAS